MEQWKNIKNYEGLYEISNLGNIRSVDREIYVENHNQYGKYKQKYKIKGKKLKQINCQGYYYVNLYKNKKAKSMRVNRLVAETFIENKEKLPCVNHKDENTLNNNVENLEWCTYKYNCNYGNRNKKISKKLRNKNGKKIIQYDKNNKIIKIYESVSQIERLFNYKHQNIIKCCKGENKSAYNYIWKYAEGEFK